MTDSMAPTLFRLGRTQAVGQIDYAVSRPDTVSKQELVTVGVREIGRVQKSGAGLIERLSMLFFSLASIWVWALKALKKTALPKRRCREPTDQIHAGTCTLAELGV